MGSLKDVVAGILAIKLRRMLNGQSPQQAKTRKSCSGCGCAAVVLGGLLVIGALSTPSSSSDKVATAAITHSGVSTEATPVATPEPVQTPFTPSIDPATVATKPILGLTRDQVMVRFPGAQHVPAYEANVDPQAVKLAMQPVTVIVYFGSNNIAEGVSFLSNSGNMGDPVTGQGSYVHQHMKTLYQMATGGAQVPYKVNSATQYPVELRIGNVHDL